MKDVRIIGGLNDGLVIQVEDNACIIQYRMMHEVTVFGLDTPDTYMPPIETIDMRINPPDEYDPHGVHWVDGTDMPKL